MSADENSVSVVDEGDVDGAEGAAGEDAADIDEGRRTEAGGGLTLLLRQQLSDQRSDHVAWRLTVRNDFDTPVTILSVEPRLPRNACAVDAMDSSLAPAAGRHGAVLGDLNRLLKMVLLPDSIPAQKQVSFEKVLYRIADVADGRAAHARWIAPLETSDLVRSLYEEKLRQLETLEAALDGEAGPKGLQTIAPGEVFCATYVIGFRRNRFEPCKYQLSFAVVHQRGVPPTTHVATVATNVLISPNGPLLSIVAVVGALLGGFMNIALDRTVLPLRAWLEALADGRLFAGVAIALIVFNVYEYTGLNKGLRMGVSWRSALLIGVLSGLAQDRMLAALNAFAG